MKSRPVRESATPLKRRLRQLIAAGISNIRPSSLFYLADRTARRGIEARTVGDVIEITRPAARQMIRLARSHALYLPLFAESFAYFFESVEPVRIHARDGPYELVDFSTPRLHRIKGFDDFPILCPSMTEPYVTTEQYLAFAKLNAGEIVLDIGAYSALASIAFSKDVGATGRVIAIEPDPLSLTAARTNIEAHRRVNEISNIVLVAAAAAAEPGRLRFTSEGAVGAALTSITGSRRGDAVEVEAVTLQSLAERFSLSTIDFVKIDIEGAELDLILGSGDFLRTYRPRLIIEPHFIDGKLTSGPIIAFLKSIAYRCQIIPQTGLLSLPLITAVPDH